LRFQLAKEEGLPLENGGGGFDFKREGKRVPYLHKGEVTCFTGGKRQMKVVVVRKEKKTGTHGGEKLRSAEKDSVSCFLKGGKRPDVGKMRMGEGWGKKGVGSVLAREGKRGVPLLREKTIEPSSMVEEEKKKVYWGALPKRRRKERKGAATENSMQKKRKGHLSYCDLPRGYGREKKHVSYRDDRRGERGYFGRMEGKKKERLYTNRSKKRGRMTLPLKREEERKR